MSWEFRQLPFWERVSAQTELAIWNDVELDDYSRNFCSIFTGHKDECGYGRIHNDEGKLVRIHRAVWERDHGKIPKGGVVRHTCDRPACIKPAHLVLGTQKDNIKDMDERGRRVNLKGSKQGCSKLTESQIPTIRSLLASGKSCEKIAVMFGVSSETIRHIKKGRNWTHVNGS
jgi:hypothetical protein